MHSIMRKYLQILEIELEDLKEDIELLIARNKEKGKKGKISSYVLLENMAVLRNELCGIGTFRKILAGINPETYSSVDEFIKDIEQQFRVRIAECGFGEGVFLMIQRKLHKVLKYVTHE